MPLKTSGNASNQRSGWKPSKYVFSGVGNAETRTEDGVDECDVRVSEEQGWLKGELESQHKVLGREAEHGRSFGLVELRLSAQERVPRQPAQTLRASDEDRRVERLGQRERENDEGEGRDPEELVERPPPAVDLRCEAADDWAEDRARDGADGPHAERVRHHLRREDVALW